MSMYSGFLGVNFEKTEQGEIIYSPEIFWALTHNEMTEVEKKLRENWKKQGKKLD